MGEKTKPQVAKEKGPYTSGGGLEISETPYSDIAKKAAEDAVRSFQIIDYINRIDLPFVERPYTEPPSMGNVLRK